MEGILSQEEIDALLSDSTADEPAGEWAPERRTGTREVRLYDFKHPEKFSREQLRSLERIFERFARLLSTTLSAYIRTNVIVRIESVTPLACQDFIFSLAQPTLIHILQLDPLPGQAALELNPSVVFPIFEQMMGGQIRKEYEPRPLTDVELTLLGRPMDRILGCLAETWQDFVAFSPMLLRVEQDPQFAQIAAVNTPVVVVSFELNVGEAFGMMSLCLPDVLVDALLHSLSIDRLPDLEHGDADRQRVDLVMGDVSLPLAAELGRTELTVAEIRDLRPGDVVRLFRRPGEELVVYVANRPLLVGEVGVRGRNLVLRITGSLREREAAAAA